MQATSKEKHSNLHARRVLRPVWIGPNVALARSVWTGRKALSTQDAQCDPKQMEPVCVNGSVHTALQAISKDLRANLLARTV